MLHGRSAPPSAARMLRLALALSVARGTVAQCVFEMELELVFCNDVSPNKVPGGDPYSLAFPQWNCDVSDGLQPGWTVPIAVYYKNKCTDQNNLPTNATSEPLAITTIYLACTSDTCDDGTHLVSPDDLLLVYPGIGVPSAWQPSNAANAAIVIGSASANGLVELKMVTNVSTPPDAPPPCPAPGPTPRPKPKPPPLPAENVARVSAAGH